MTKKSGGHSGGGHSGGGHGSGGGHHHGGGTTLGAPAVALPPLKDAHPLLYEAASIFVQEHCNFESSAATKSCVNDLGEATSLQQAFAVPLRHKMLDMDSALYWVLFLQIGPARAAADGEAPPGEPFSAGEALNLIKAVYDNGVQTHILEHFEPDSDDDSSSSGSDAGEASGEEKEPADG